jgi:hypothetical protein
VAGDGADRCGSLATIGRPLAERLPETTQRFEPWSAGAVGRFAASRFSSAALAAFPTSGASEDDDKAGPPCFVAGSEVSPGKIDGACANGSLRITSSKNNFRPSKPSWAPAVW